MLGMGKVARNQAANILGERDARLARAPAGATLQLIFKRNLRPYHHDGTIIPSFDRQS